MRLLRNTVGAIGAAFLGAVIAASFLFTPAAPRAPDPAPAPAATPALPPCLEPARELPQLAPMAGLVRPARYIVMHHWGAPPPASIASARAAFRARGWNDIAYNALFTMRGEAWPGRPESEASGATFGLNDRSVAGVMLEDLTHRPATDAAVGAFGRWLAGALRRHPHAIFIQHRDAGRLFGYGTTCAGEASQRDRTARAVWLVACGFKVPEARRRARAGL